MRLVSPPRTGRKFLPSPKENGAAHNSLDVLPEGDHIGRTNKATPRHKPVGLPSPSRLSLPQAARRVADRLGAYRFSSEIPEAIYGDLCAGILVARGREEDAYGNILHQDHEVAPTIWCSLTSEEFLGCFSRNRFPYQPDTDPRPSATRYYSRISLATADIDAWSQR